MVCTHTQQAFARKLIHGRTTGTEEIDNEALVISSIQEKGGDRHIIAILRHGWLTDPKRYFIDMELANFTLFDYLRYHDPSQSESAALNIVASSSPVLVIKDPPLTGKWENMWMIGVHISRGLEFLHSHKHVHRDLKPKNVLYCSRDNVWKLADFGISSDATSNAAHPTPYFRGTSSYRAPELLRDPPTFTNKVDIWALGCILHELATSQVAFGQDWAVVQYDKDKRITVLRDPISSPSVLLRHHVPENIRELLNRDHNQRPKASVACRIFSSYCEFLSLPVAHDLLKVSNYPWYQEWKQLTEPSALGGGPFLHNLATAFERNGKENFELVKLLRSSGLKPREMPPTPSDSTTEKSARQKAARLTPVEKELLIKNKGCFYCRNYNAGHEGAACPLLRDRQAARNAHRSIGKKDKKDN